MCILTYYKLFVIIVLFSYNETPISFQPEVGSVSFPTLRSLQRFMPPSALQTSAIPSYLQSYNDVNTIWKYYKYLPFITETYDHIYAYSNLNNKSTININEFIWRAQLIQFQQYLGLIDGFLLRQFEFYTAVFIWKSQSPWPTLRGALYDYYLDYTGSYAGVSSGLTTTTIYNNNKVDDDNNSNVDNNNSNNNNNIGNSDNMNSNDEQTNCDNNICDDNNNIVNKLGMKTTSSLQIIFNPQTRQVSLVNRSPTTATNISIYVEITYLNGIIFYSDTFFINKGVVPGNKVVTSKKVLPWKNYKFFTGKYKKSLNNVNLYFFSILHNNNSNIINHNTTNISSDNNNNNIYRNNISNSSSSHSSNNKTNTNNNANTNISQFHRISLPKVYWLGEPSMGNQPNYALLGELRKLSNTVIITKILKPISIINNTLFNAYYRNQYTTRFHSNSNNDKNSNDNRCDNNKELSNILFPNMLFSKNDYDLALAPLISSFHMTYTATSSTTTTPVTLSDGTKGKFHSNKDFKKDTIKKNMKRSASKRSASTSRDTAISSHISNSYTLFTNSIIYAVIELECPITSPYIAFMLRFTLLYKNKSHTKLTSSHLDGNNSNNMSSNTNPNIVDEGKKKTNRNNTHINTMNDPRVLPTFYSSHYITLRPNEKITLVIAAPIHNLNTINSKDTYRTSTNTDDYNIINRKKKKNKEEKMQINCYKKFPILTDYTLEIEGFNLKTMEISLS